MQILVDTREQRPLDFQAYPLVTQVCPETLTVGDYAVRYTSGVVPPVRFERKSLGDLFSTMTSGYPRFKREILRAQAAHLQLILMIEGTLTRVYQGFDRSQLAGESCVKKLFTLAVRYELYPVFCQSRGEMADFMVETFAALGRSLVVPISVPRPQNKAWKNRAVQ